MPFFYHMFWYCHVNQACIKQHHQYLYGQLWILFRLELCVTNVKRLFRFNVQVFLFLSCKIRGDNCCLHHLEQSAECHHRLNRKSVSKLFCLGSDKCILVHDQRDRLFLTFHRGQFCNTWYMNSFLSSLRLWLSLSIDQLYV